MSAATTQLPGSRCHPEFCLWESERLFAAHATIDGPAILPFAEVRQGLLRSKMSAVPFFPSLASITLEQD